MYARLDNHNGLVNGKKKFKCTIPPSAGTTNVFLVVKRKGIINNMHSSLLSLHIHKVNGFNRIEHWCAIYVDDII